MHWHDPAEKHLMSTGDWTDLDYDACVFLGARSSNLPELTMLPSLRCGHFRSSDEWPRTSDAVFPTFAEAEYTNILPVWSLQLQLQPQPGLARQVGDVNPSRACHPSILLATSEVSWPFHLNPFAVISRSCMTALHMGLRPDEALERGAPLRRDASEFPDKILPDNYIYIGPGHEPYRWPAGLLRCGTSLIAGRSGGRGDSAFMGP